jgi:oligopeptide/dipeptide ABC transporter ATP-binding protein
MPHKPETLLSIRDLVVEHPPVPGSRNPIKAVRGVSLDIEVASIYGLVGESGSGKSSLAHAILRLVAPVGGQVFFRGTDLFTLNRSALRKTRQEIQLVFQDSLASLSPRRSIRQTLLEPLDHFRIGHASTRIDKVMAVLETVGLDTALADRYPQALSGGQRQRVALARAMITKPSLIIADEPVSSLDASVQSRITDLILDLRDRLGIAFLFVSHDLTVVRKLADRVGVMYLGQLVESGPGQELFAQPAHPYTQALLRAVPVADPGHPAPVALSGEPPSPLTPPAGCVFHKRCPDVFEPCSTQEPAESAVIGEPGLKTCEHRVRCHQWKSAN